MKYCLVKRKTVPSSRKFADLIVLSSLIGVPLFQNAKFRVCGVAAHLPVSCELRLAIKCEITLGKEKQGTITYHQNSTGFIDSVI